MSEWAAPLLAAVPIALILILMIGLRWPAAWAGGVGVGVAILLALVVFGLGTEVYPHVGSLALAGTLGEAAFTTLTILWILFPALSIHHLQTRTGAVDVLRSAIAQLSADPRMLAILVAWFFALFVEGAAGFGTPVALAAPFLVAAGFAPVQAVVIVLLGHAVGVSFGAVGTPVVAQIAVTDLGGLEISRATVLYHGLLGWIMPLFLAATVSRAVRVPGASRYGLAVWALLAGASFALPYFLLAYWIGPELPTLLGAICGMLVFILVVKRLGRGRLGETGPPPARAPARQLLRAGTPYLTLVVIVLVTRLVAPVREMLVAIEWEWSAFGEFGGSVLPLYHPGTALLAGFLVGAVVQRAPVQAIVGAMVRTARQLAPVTLALLAMLSLSRVMVHAGMIDSLAIAAASGVGRAWPLLAPLVGVLGSFVTGSATASNILFTDFQEATATALELPVLPLVGAQGFGAGVGNIICPHNIIAGSATVGLSGREGEILRQTLWPCILYAGLGGIVALLLVG